jgi:DNA-binding NarL/FixJ family response regulator
MTSDRAPAPRASLSVGGDLTKAVRVLVVAGVRLYRDGLAAALGQHPRLRVVGTAGERTEAVAKTQRLRPQIVLLDVATFESLAIAQSVATAAPEARLVALGVPDDVQYILACAEAGLSGYITRDASLDDVIAIISGAAGPAAGPRAARLAGVLRRPAAEPARGPRLGTAGGKLTIREVEILQLIDRGLSNKELARDLGIAVATVKNHVHKILEKLQARRRSEAVARFRNPSEQARYQFELPLPGEGPRSRS